MTRKKSEEDQVASVRCRPPSKLALASRHTPSLLPPINCGYDSRSMKHTLESLNRQHFTEDSHKNQDSASIRLLKGKSCLGVFTNPIQLLICVKVL